MRSAVLAGLWMLAGCDRAATPPPAVSGAAGAGAASAAASSIVPHDGELPRSGKPNGPAEGAAAIGGLSGNQERGGAETGRAPQPTGGDGGASVPSGR